MILIILLLCITTFSNLSLAKTEDYTERYIKLLEYLETNRKDLSQDSEIQKDIDDYLTKARIYYKKEKVSSEADGYLKMKQGEVMDESWLKMLKKYPILEYIDTKVIDKSINKPQIKLTGKILSENMNYFWIFNPEKCMKDGKLKIENKQCINDVIKSCSDTFIAKEKKLLLPTFLDENLEFKITELQNFEKLKETFAENYNYTKENRIKDILLLLYYPCIQASELGIEFENKSKLYFKNDVPEWLKLFINMRANTEENFDKKCLSAPNSSIFKKMLNFSRMDKLGFIPKEGIEHHYKYCNEVASLICQRVNVSNQNNIYMSYVTSNCDIRNVTENDIEQDVQKWKDLNLTEADINSHLGLKTTISRCKKANEYGFITKFNFPSLKSCKKK